MLLPQLRVRGGEAHGAGLFFGADPDSAGATDQGEGIVADNFGGAIEFQFDGIVGEGADGAEFVGDAQDDASGIGAIGVEFSVVGEQSKFLVEAAAGKSFGNDLLALDVAVNAQISPSEDGFLQIGDKRGIAKVGKFGFVGADFRHQLVRNVEFQMIAIRTDDGLGEADGFIAAGPMEGRLEDDFFFGIALGLVKAGGGLGFAENVGDAVIADAVAGAEVAVSVVVKGAPADASRVLRIGSELIVDARVAHGVFGEALDLVDGLGGIRVTNEFSVEVARVVGRLQGETEIVHGENVFEEFGFLEVADAAGGAGGVETVSEGVGAYVEIVVVAGFVDARAPQDDAGMIPVAANHAADVIDGDFLPRLVADVLPAGNFFEDEQAHFVAGIEEMAGLRIVRGADDVAMEFVAEDARVAVLGAGGHGLSDEGKCLMAVEAAELNDLAVQFEAVLGELCFAEADGALVLIDQLCAAQ